ncbi:MAG: Rpp14/Pop5 family protein [Candidatus Micrarchaeia archaeon]
MILKKKNRYVLVESPQKISEQDYVELRSKLLDFMGVQAYAEAGPRIINVSENSFAIKTGRNTERQVILATSFIRSLGGSRACLCTTKVSGTIKALLSRA